MKTLILTTAVGLALLTGPVAAADRSGTTTGTGTSVDCTGPSATSDPRCASRSDRSRSFDTRGQKSGSPMTSPQRGPEGESSSDSGSGNSSGGGASGSGAGSGAGGAGGGAGGGSGGGSGG